MFWIRGRGKARSRKGVPLVHIPAEPPLEGVSEDPQFFEKGGTRPRRARSGANKQDCRLGVLKSVADVYCSQLCFLLLLLSKNQQNSLGLQQARSRTRQNNNTKKKSKTYSATGRSASYSQGPLPTFTDCSFASVSACCVVVVAAFLEKHENCFLGLQQPWARTEETTHALPTRH